MILIVYYRHDKKDDEMFFLKLDQIKKYFIDSKWGDLAIKKKERDKYIKEQNLFKLVKYCKGT